MQVTRDGSRDWKPPKTRTNSAHDFVSWKPRFLRMWYQVTRVPKEDLLIGGMFATVIMITIWLAARLL
jgi:hypothetical protein